MAKAESDLRPVPGADVARAPLVIGERCGRRKATHTPTPWVNHSGHLMLMGPSIGFPAHPNGKAIAKFQTLADLDYAHRAVNAYQQIKDALGTDEDGDALIEVARNAHRAEQELAAIKPDDEPCHGPQDTTCDSCGLGSP